ncbi:MAG: hypothetical protein V7L01_03050 [Nostoc sp.]|uniref:ATP-grasp domain-containing protein n=1 Tax=Nostoc sp. TaxID=1180 RepID=UPI002FF4CC6A
MQKHIAIITFEHDMHGLAIKKALESRDDVTCYMIEADKLCDSAGLNWSNINNLEKRSTIPSKDLGLQEVSNLDVIWWRRTNFPQQMPPHITDSIYIDVINNDCSTTLLGILFNEFSGSWVNDPTKILLADNKLIQLRAAQSAGFQIPQTLVSQNPTQIKQFCEKLENNVIVKPVKGTRQVSLFTKMLTEEHLASDASLRLCPAIYQEYIPGHQHVRAHCFGDNIYAVLIESEELDWRQNLDIPFSFFDLEESVKICLRKVLKTLGLKMGIVDLKLTEGKNPVWLEINQQGQFLFCEGLSGLDLTSAFVEFLYQEAKQVSRG